MRNRDTKALGFSCQSTLATSSRVQKYEVALNRNGGCFQLRSRDARDSSTVRIHCKKWPGLIWVTHPFCMWANTVQLRKVLGPVHPSTANARHQPSRLPAMRAAKAARGTHGSFHFFRKILPVQRTPGIEFKETADDGTTPERCEHEGPQGKQVQDDVPVALQASMDGIKMSTELFNAEDIGRAKHA